MKTESSSEKSPAAPQRANLMKRVALGLGLVLVCYFLVAYVILPFGWKLYTQTHPSFDDNPRLTKTGVGHLGGPLNVALIGSENQLRSSMATAKWYEANPLGVKSDLKIAADTVLCSRLIR